jgi:hypothetical protein
VRRNKPPLKEKLTVSFTTFDPDRVDQIVETLASMLQRRSIARELESLRQFAVIPEHVDELVLAAINTSLNLEDERLAAEISDISIDLEPMRSKAARAA